ncbi:hypothetical protein ACO1O0_003442 [Amphichorda felina]
MMPELKGQRCACVTFSRDKSLPGAMCDCGHLACFHLISADAPSPGRNRDQIENVKQRINVLEQQVELYGEHADLSQVVPRLSQLEETMDRNREELQNEIKGSYRNISAAWQLIEQLQRRMVAFEETHRVQSEQLTRAGKELEDLRNRNLELLETDEMLEERIERLEGMDALPSPVLEPLTKDVASDLVPNPMPSNVFQRRRSSASRPTLPLTNMGNQTSTQLVDASTADTKLSEASGASGAWTVHISLLPSRELPFPFEKDTTAYKRCLSRGLQRMVAVEGTDGKAFISAVSRAFRNVLQGASWEPLRAKICDARKLEGLPMLRTLGRDAGHGDYNLEFLRRHCGVCDADGRIQALYLGVQEKALSWPKIKQLPVYVEGLESSWEYDKYLDHRGDDDDDKDSIGTSCQAELSWPATPSSSDMPSSKRSASEMQSTALATGGVRVGENEGPMAKKSRKCMPGMIEIR